LGVLCALRSASRCIAGGIRLNLATFFRWTGLFIIFVRQGLAASAIRAFHEAGNSGNALQQTALDV